jgi:hypothetical protein
MPTLVEFLEGARFPSPPIQITGSVNTTDVSSADIGLVDEAWKARRAVQDHALVDHLCGALQQILGTTPFPEAAIEAADFLRSFSPHLDRDTLWQEPNVSESRVRHHPPSTAQYDSLAFNQSTHLLIMGVHLALRRFMQIYNPERRVACRDQPRSGQSLSRVDWAVFVDDEDCILVEAKSPTVMRAISEILPPIGAHLQWREGGGFLARIFLKVFPFHLVLYVSKGKRDQVAAYLALRHKEWLFLTCHNSWIVFRLVNVNGDRILAYSPVLEIANSSIPFRAYLGALLSVIEDFPVLQTVFAANPILETLPEDSDEDDSVSESESDESHEYRPPGGASASGNGTASPPVTRSRGRVNDGHGDPELMVRFLATCVLIS